MEINKQMPKPRGAQIRELRVKRGWPQEQLAEVAGVSLKTVQRAEAEQVVALDTLQALASALNVEVGALLKEPETKATEEAMAEFLKSHKVYHLTKLTSGKALLEVVGGAGSFYFDHPEPKDREEMALIQDFSQNVHDTIDIWSDVEPGYRVELGFNLSEAIKELSKRGISIFGTSRNMKYTHVEDKKSFTMSNALVVLQRADHPTIVKVSDELEVLPVAIPNGPVRFT